MSTLHLHCTLFQFSHRERYSRIMQFYAQNFGNVFSRISSSTMTKQPPETAPAKIPSPGDAALKAEPSLHMAKAWDLTTNPPTNSVKVMCCMFHKGLRIESFANRRMFHFNRVTLSPTFSVELDVV